MQNGYTALMLAASKGHLNVVQCLVEAGANLEATTSNVSGHVVWECVDVVDAVWMHSIDASFHGWPCECDTMLGGSGSEPRYSRRRELTLLIVGMYAFVSHHHQSSSSSSSSSP